MKKNRSEKEIARLRAQVEALKAQIKVYPPAGEIETPKKKVDRIDERPAPVTAPFEPGTTAFLKADLSKTFGLTVLSLSLIFALKVAVIPNEKTISQKISGLYQLVTSAFGKITTR